MSIFKRLAGLLLLLSLLVCGRVYAQADGTLDTTFKYKPGISPAVVNVISTIVQQPDGKILIGGCLPPKDNKTKCSNRCCDGIARLNSDGSLDTTFNVVQGFNGGVSNIAIQADGKILATGDVFGFYNGVRRGGIARLLADGRVDSTFKTHLIYGRASASKVIIPQPDGKIVVAPQEPDSVNHMTYIRRLNSDGSIDKIFYSGLGLDGICNSGVMQKDGKFIVGGKFCSFNGIKRYHIARLNANGTLDTSFKPNLGYTYNVETILLQPDGKVLVGGAFNDPMKMRGPSIVRLNSDGTRDYSFVCMKLNMAVVKTLALQPNGRILVGGWRSKEILTPQTLVRLNSDGSLDTSILPQISGSVRSICQQSDGKLLIGGWGFFFPLIPVDGIVRLNNERLLPWPTILTRSQARCY